MASTNKPEKNFSSLLSKNRQPPAATAAASTTEPKKVQKEREKKVQLGTVITPNARLYMDRTWAKAGFRSYAEFVDKAIIKLAKEYPYWNVPLESENQED
jgi:hypothetical protein